MDVYFTHSCVMSPAGILVCMSKTLQGLPELYGIIRWEMENISLHWQCVQVILSH